MGCSFLGVDRINVLLQHRSSYSIISRRFPAIVLMAETIFWGRSVAHNLWVTNSAYEVVHPANSKVNSFKRKIPQEFTSLSESHISPRS